MIHNNRLFNQPQPLLITRERTSLDSENGGISTQLVNDAPKELTNEEKEAKIENIIKQFVSGNMTRFEAEQELDELGINCASSDNANDRVLNFEFNNKKYQITCSRVAANDGKGGNVVEAITPEEVNAVVQKYGDDAKKYFKAVATVDGKPTAYALDFTNWPEGVNKTLAALQTELAKPKESAEEKAVREFIENYTNSDTDISGDNFEILKNLLSAAGISYKEEQQTVFGKVLRGLEFEFGGVTHTFYTNEAATNAPADDFTSTSPAKFKESQLAGFDDNAIMRYFTRQEDGTYIMNEANITADFPEAKYGKIDTPEKLKKAIADSVKADTTGSTAGAGGAGATGGTNGAGSTNDSGSVAPKDEVTGGGNNDTTPAVNNSATGTFKSYTETRNYIFSNEARDAVKAAGITDFSKGFAYENIADTVAKAHEKDFASITKEQLIEEFKTEYNKRIGGNNGTGEVNGTGTGNAGGAGGAGGVGGTDVTDSVAQPPEAQKGQAKSTVMNEVMKAYTTGNGDYGITTKHSDAQRLGKFLSKVANAIDEFVKSYTGSTDGYLKALQDHIKTVVPALIQEVEDEIKAGEAGNTPATQYTKEDLQKTYHLTDSDIGNFFKKNGDKYEINTTATKSCFGKEINNVQDLLNAMQKEPIAIGYIYGAYSMGSDKYLQYFTVTGEGNDKKFTMNMTKIKQDFPDKNITTIGQLKAAVDAKGSTTGGTSGTNGTDGTRGTGGTNGTSGANGTSSTTPEETTVDAKTQTKNNAKAALDALTKNDTTAIRSNRISSTINSLEQEYASNNKQSTKVNTGYSINSNGDINFTNSYVKTMYDDLLAHIKEVVGTDSFDNNTLVDLYQTAWQMTYNPYPSSRENDISDFLTKVYNNFKAILTRLQNKPEYLDIFTGKTATSGTRAVNAGNQTTGGGYVNCDKMAQTYTDGSIHVSDDQSDANLQKAVKTLTEKLQKAYPDIPEATLKRLINNAVQRAVGNIGNQRKTEIPKNFSISGTQTYANTITNLAAYYFEQSLYNVALTDNTLTSGNTKPEEKTITVDDATKTKFKNAATSINNMLTDIFDSSYIKGLLGVNGCDGTYWLEMDVNSSGNFRFSDSKTETAYNKLFEAMKAKSGFRNSGLTESEFKQIYNAAWLDSYNGYDNNQKYNLNDVLNKVVSNMRKIMNKLSSNPEYMNLIKGGSSMTKITSSTTNLVYKYTNVDRDYGDGNVHLSGDNSDRNYQKYIEEFKTKLKGSYVPPLSESQFNSWFLQAQKDAIKACAEDSRDITKDLQVKRGTRYKDGSAIEVNKLMELIAYKFDKIMYKNIFGAA